MIDFQDEPDIGSANTNHELLLIGAGGHALACIDVIESGGLYHIVGLVGKHDELGKKQQGYEVIATDDDLSKLIHQYPQALVTVGQIKTPALRFRLYKQLKEFGFTLPQVISPRAYVSRRAFIGEGTIIMHDALVNAGARVGANCIINTKALIEHNAVVGDHCHLSTGCIINGNTVVSQGCFIGSGAVLKNGIVIGENSTIGMGVCVRKCTKSNARIIF